MSHLKCYILFIVFVFWINLKCTYQVSFQYHGDVSVKQFLTKFCHSTSSHRIKLIYIYNLNMILTPTPPTSYTSNFTSQYAQYLKQINCDHLYVNKPSVSSVAKEIDAKLQYGKTQFLFDFSSAAVDSEKLRSILHVLALLYGKCTRCQPIISIFSLPQNRLFQISSKLFPELPINFQSILVDDESSKAVFIRPVLNACDLQHSVFIAKSQADFARLKATRCNLHSRRLKVAVNNVFPYCFYNMTANSQINAHYSIEFELLNAMTEAYNFSAELIDANDTWGAKINGRWNGLIGMVHEGKVDFGMCEIMLMKARLEVVEFARFTFLDQLVYISQSPSIQKHGFLLSKVSPTVWICQLVAFTVIVLLLHFNRHLLSGKSFRLDKSTFNTLRLFIFQLYGLFLKQSIRPILHESIHSNRLLYGFWMLVGLILSNAFSSLFYAVLTVPEYGRPIDTLEDLLYVAKTNSHFILTQYHSAMLATILNASPDDVVNWALKQNLERNNRKMVKSTTEYISRVEADKRNVLISLKLSLQAQRYLYATKPLHIGSEALGSVYQSWVLPKISPLTAQFNKIIIRLREMDVLEKWQRNAIRKVAIQIPTKKIQYSVRKNLVTTKQTQQTFKTLLLDDLSSVFVIFGYCIVFCYLEFICEIVLEKCFNRAAERKRPNNLFYKTIKLKL